MQVLKTLSGFVSKLRRNNGVTRSVETIRPSLLERSPVVDTIRVSTAKTSAFPTARQMAEESGMDIPERLQKAWDEVIPQIRNNPTETAVVHNFETGEEIARTKIGTEIGTNFDFQGQLNIFDAAEKNIKVAVIHNHPFEMSFSPDDLFGGIARATNYHTLAIVSRDGGYAIAQRVRNLDEEEFVNAITNFWHPMCNFEGFITAKMQSQGKANVEIIRELSKFREKHLPSVTEASGFKYYYKPGELNPVNVPSYSLSEGFVNNFAEFAEIDKDELLQVIDKTPIEYFYEPLSSERLTDLLVPIKKVPEA